jgi:general secretion pathway protein N
MTRQRLWIAAAIVLALLMFAPLRFVVGVVGLDDAGISSRTASGLIWFGRLDQARAGKIDIGTLDVGLQPLGLALGQTNFDFARSDAAGEALSGTVVRGIDRRGVADVTGSLAGGDIGGLPVERLTFERVSVLFAGGLCREAEGRVTLVPGLTIAGLQLRNGLTGPVRCEGRAATMTLAGQSGMERLTMSIDPDGSYTVRLGVQAADPLLGAALTAAGFGPTAEGYVRTSRGRF